LSIREAHEDALPDRIMIGRMDESREWALFSRRSAIMSDGEIVLGLNVAGRGGEEERRGGVLFRGCR
jgi:hypothetical protein